MSSLLQYIALYLCGEVGEFTGDVKPLITELMKLPTTDIVFGGGDGEFGTFWSPNAGGKTWKRKKILLFSLA